MLVPVLIVSALLPLAGPAITLSLRRRWLGLWLALLALSIPLLGWTGTALMTFERCRGGGCMGTDLVLFGALALAVLTNLPAAIYRVFTVRGYR